MFPSFSDPICVDMDGTDESALLVEIKSWGKIVRMITQLLEQHLTMIVATNSNGQGRQQMYYTEFWPSRRRCAGHELEVDARL